MNSDYQALKLHLSKPHQLHRTNRHLQHSQGAYHDPQWPAPKNFEEVLSLLSRLSSSAKLLCAITATELTTAIWITQNSPDLRENLLQAVSANLDAQYAALNGSSTNRQLRHVRRLTDIAYAEESFDTPCLLDHPYKQATAAAEIYHRHKGTIGASLMTAFNSACNEAVYHASISPRYSGAPQSYGPIAFYDEWWQLCMKRLSSQDPTTEQYTGFSRFYTFESPAEKKTLFQRIANGMTALFTR